MSLQTVARKHACKHDLNNVMCYVVPSTNVCMVNLELTHKPAGPTLPLGMMHSTVAGVLTEGTTTWEQACSAAIS